MLALLSPVRRWLGRRLLGTANGRTLDVSRVSALPRRFQWPLRRDIVDPVPELGRLRAREPVSRLGGLFGMGIWLVTGHEAVQEVLRDRKNYSNDIRPYVGDTTGRASSQIGGLGFTDPPEHTRLRAFLTSQFTRRRLSVLQPRVDQIIDDQLDLVQAAGATADLVPTFAFPIPFQVICELLGLPIEDRERFRQLGPARFDLSHGGMGALGAMSESRELLLEAVRRQRVEPGAGLIGRLIVEHGDELDDVELAGLADGVFLGGYETSVSMLSLGSLVLLRSRDTFARLVQADDDAVDDVVEELLRYLSVVQIAFPRFAKQDLRLRGMAISKGDMVACSLIGANRDEVFGPDAGSFAPRGRAGAQVAFGYGLHRCVGAELARLELRAAFRALARRFPDMELAVEPDELRFRDLSVVYGIESLPVRTGVPA